MIVYSEPRTKFEDDALNHRIAGILKDRVGRAFHMSPGAGEFRAWDNSLSALAAATKGSDIPDDSNVAIEFGIPGTTRRVDAIVSGLNRSGVPTAVIIELKQWSWADKVDGKDGLVVARYEEGPRETLHPSCQAWSYAEAIQLMNEGVRESGVVLLPCAYLHNYVLGDPSTEPLLDGRYGYYVGNAPLFDRMNYTGLTEYIGGNIDSASGTALDKLENGPLAPSKSLQDAIAGMIRGNREFVLLDDQKVVFENIADKARRCGFDGRKRTVIVRGGPGTGKSVIAVNLLAKLTGEGMTTRYVSWNRAPRSVYGYKLKGERTRRQVDYLFTGSGSFVGEEDGKYDALVVDEAHRLTEKTVYARRKPFGENQVREVIHASKLSVFFIDESQAVKVSDFCTIPEIERCATAEGSEFCHYSLRSQFRCSGSDDYIDWVESALQIRPLEPFVFRSREFVLRVYDDPCEMRAEIERMNEASNKSRMVAGYCWNWNSEHKSDPDFHDVVIEESGFGMSWNLGSTETWAVDKGSVNEIGCIHTCQGLEFDYVGVIVGDDMRFEDGRVITDASKRARTDSSLHGLHSRYPDGAEAKRVADRIIRNTYRVLMTRGMKGCFVYCTDRALADHLRSLVQAGAEEPEP